jgi:hypothetical protein
VEPFYFTLFGTKWLQTASEAVGEAMPNGALKCVHVIRKRNVPQKKGSEGVFVFFFKKS